jgi:hypothetical protein
MFDQVSNNFGDSPYRLWEPDDIHNERWDHNVREVRDFGDHEVLHEHVNKDVA